MFRITLVMLLAFVSTATGAQDSEKTHVVVLGVEHAGQLFVKEYRPAVLRAWLERVRPDAIAVERHPEAFARNDFYGFTYELQNIALPWARENRVPVHPFDWEPSRQDQQLAFGFDLQSPPLIRPASGWGSFTTFNRDAIDKMDLFLGEQEARRQQAIEWSRSQAANGMGEMARRLYLFRTQLQAQRIRHAAERHRGGALVVIVGWMHQPDLETHLARDASIELVKASHFGYPDDAEASANETLADRIAIAWANLFGMQSMEHGVDLDWLDEVVTSLEGRIPAHEHASLALRLRELQGNTERGTLLREWLQLADTLEHERRSWAGKVNSRRIDSVFDPFAGLNLQQRALHEASRLQLQNGQQREAKALRDRVASSLRGDRHWQYLGYWERHVRERLEPALPD